MEKKEKVNLKLVFYLSAYFWLCFVTFCLGYFLGYSTGYEFATDDLISFFTRYE